MRKRARQGVRNAKNSAYKIQMYNNFKVDQYIDSVDEGVPNKPPNAMLWAELSVLNKPQVYSQYNRIINSRYTNNDAFTKMLIRNQADKNLNRIVEAQVNRVAKNLDFTEKVLANYEVPVREYRRLLDEQKNRSLANRREILQETLKENGETLDLNRYNVNYREISVMVEQQMNEIRSASDYEECQAMNEKAESDGKSPVITMKQWEWTGAGKTTRHMEMENYPVIDFDKSFQVVDENTDTVDRMLYPRDTDGSPQNVYGCVCEINYF